MDFFFMGDIYHQLLIDIQLDICGGHNNSSYGQHYHTQVLHMNVSSSQAAPSCGITLGLKITAYIPGVYECIILNV
jgi:hypothetical protein